MSTEEAIRFLGAGTRTGSLATVRTDGRPHVAPVWFIVEGDHVVFMTWHTSVKAKNLLGERRAALLVDLPEPPYAFVLVEGPVEIIDDHPDLVRVATEIGGRYMGADRAKEYGRRNGAEGELVIRLHMDRVVARHDVSG